MSKLTNATGGTRRWWGVMPILPAPVMGGMARQMEAVGFEGCFSLQIYGPPFVPMAAVAAMTDSLKVSTGIAVAGTRSPVETAFAAMACINGPPWLPGNTAEFNFFASFSSRAKIMPERGPRRVLCVVVVTTSANGTGLG